MRSSVREALYFLPLKEIFNSNSIASSWGLLAVRRFKSWQSSSHDTVCFRAPVVDCDDSTSLSREPRLLRDFRCDADDERLLPVTLLISFTGSILASETETAGKSDSLRDVLELSLLGLLALEHVDVGEQGVDRRSAEALRRLVKAYVCFTAVGLQLELDEAQSAFSDCTLHETL